MRALAVWTTFLVVGLVSAQDDAEANKKVLDSLQGVWLVEKAEKGGKPAPEDKIARTRLHVEGSKLTFKTEDRTEEVTFTVDVSKKPHALDIMPPEKEMKIEGIFRLEGDMLTIVFGGEGRPTEFTSPPGTRVSLIHLRRAKQ